MKDGYSPHCKLCASVLNKASRDKKKEQYCNAESMRRQKKRDELNVWKAEQGCRCCLEKDPVCLDMHHLDPNTKDDVVSALLINASRTRLWEEIEKCVVLCRNCHAKVHHGSLMIATSNGGRQAHNL